MKKKEQLTRETLMELQHWDRSFSRINYSREEDIAGIRNTGRAKRAYKSQIMGRKVGHRLPREISPICNVTNCLYRCALLYFRRDTEE